MTEKARSFLLKLQHTAATDSSSGSRNRLSFSRAALFMASHDAAVAGHMPDEGAVFEYFQDAANELGCGRLDDMFAYAVLMRNVKQIEAAVEEVYHIKLDPLPTFGTLPHGDMNAHTLRVPQTLEDFVVVFQQGLFDFLFALTETVTAILPFEKNGDLIFPSDQASGLNKTLLTEVVRNRIKEKILEQEHDKSLLHFLEAVTSYLLSANLDSVPIWWGREQLQFKSYLIKSSIRFVVAHELGHIYKGHLSTANDWNKEYVADFEGFWIGDLAPFVSRTEARAFGAMWGAELFFCACELVERAYSVLEFGEGGHRLSNSHPPPQLRRQTLRSNVRNFAMAAENGDNTTIDRLFAPGFLLEIVAAELWQTVEDCFLNLHKIGYRPAAIWRDCLTYPD